MNFMGFGNCSTEWGRILGIKGGWGKMAGKELTSKG